MADQNDHTGARLVTKATTPEYEKGYDLVFGKKKPIKLEMQDDVKLSAKTMEHFRELEKKPAVLGGEQD